MISSAAEFCRLRESDNPDEYVKAAQENASIEVWREVIRDRPDMRFWVAQNKTVPVEILEELAGDPDVRVRDLVARKRKINEAVAIKLARDPDESVRATLAYNPKLPGKALDILRADQSPFVQESVRHLKKAANQPPEPTASGRGSS